jgi:hypothetical protein
LIALDKFTLLGGDKISSLLLGPLIVCKPPLPPLSVLVRALVDCGSCRVVDGRPVGW